MTTITAIEKLSIKSQETGNYDEFDEAIKKFALQSTNHESSEFFESLLIRSIQCKDRRIINGLLYHVLPTLHFIYDSSPIFNLCIQMNDLETLTELYLWYEWEVYLPYAGVETVIQNKNANMLRILYTASHIPSDTSLEDVAHDNITLAYEKCEECLIVVLKQFSLNRSHWYEHYHLPSTIYSKVTELAYQHNLSDPLGTLSIILSVENYIQGEVADFTYNRLIKPYLSNPWVALRVYKK